MTAVPTMLGQASSSPSICVPTVMRGARNLWTSGVEAVNTFRGSSGAIRRPFASVARIDLILVRPTRSARFFPIRKSLLVTTHCERSPADSLRRGEHLVLASRALAQSGAPTGRPVLRSPGDRPRPTTGRADRRPRRALVPSPTALRGLGSTPSRMGQPATSVPGAVRPGTGPCRYRRLPGRGDERSVVHPSFTERDRAELGEQVEAVQWVVALRPFNSPAAPNQRTEHTEVANSARAAGPR